MTVSPNNMNMVGTSRNFTVDDCFSSQNTVLKGQPFGGIPTVLFLNITVWVVSAGHCGGRTEGSHPGHMVQLSQGVKGPQLSVDTSHSGGKQLNVSLPRAGAPWRPGGFGYSQIPDSFSCTLVRRPPLASALEPPIWPLDGFFKESFRPLL